ncbi:hypothetical protein ABMA32_15905 [Mesorhizobium sp. VNQ89]|uniref:hypothetical protein n=1 Tax=Mesorhizobium quangtriensis TaxID=3157709 RepID=UPI0032B76069
MPVLKSAKHERMAQSLAKGLSSDKAYAEAGYKPHRGNAARLSANENIMGRVTELQKERIEKVHEYAAVDFREQMHKLIGIVDKAIETGDIKTALDGQKFIMKMGGFEDMPTLTHEMLGDRGLHGFQRSAEPGEPVRKNILQFGPAHRKLIELAGPRTIDLKG